MITFHQILVGATPGDAITNSSLVIRDLLRQVTPDAEVFALFLDPSLDGTIRPLQTFDEWCEDRGQDPILFYHASIGDPLMLSFLLERPEPMIMIYHNISPSQPFLPFDPAFAGKLAEGRRELQEIRAKVILSLADSRYNAAELVDLGFEDVRVSPLLIDLEALAQVPADEALLEDLGAGGPVVLFVGQLLPHKRPDLLLQMYHALSTYLDPDVRLFIVGPDRLVPYRDAVQRYIDELNLRSARITGPVSPSELAAFYRGSSLFATMSEHEGFCVPLVESMRFGLPVLARREAAIPETAGDSALLLDSFDPFLAAEAATELLSNADLRTELSARGSRRAQALAADDAKATFLQHVLSVIP